MEKSYFLNTDGKMEMNKLLHFSFSLNSTYALFDNNLLAWIPQSENLFLDNLEFLKNQPIDIKMNSFGMKKIIKIFCNNQVVHSITEEGLVFSWGNDRDKTGILGLGYTYNQSFPLLNTNFTNKRITEISLSNKHAAAIDFAHEIFTWGTGPYNELGEEGILFSNVPIPIKLENHLFARKIQCGSSYTLLIDFNGNVIYFGKIFDSTGIKNNSSLSNNINNENKKKKNIFEISRENSKNNLRNSRQDNIIPGTASKVEILKSNIKLIRINNHVSNIYCGPSIIAIIDNEGSLYLYNDEEGLYRVKLEKKIVSVKFANDNFYALTISKNYIYEFVNKSKLFSFSNYTITEYQISQDFSKITFIEQPYYSNLLFLEVECSKVCKDEVVLGKKKIFTITSQPDHNKSTNLSLGSRYSSDDIFIRENILIPKTNDKMNMMLISEDASVCKIDDVKIDLSSSVYPPNRRGDSKRSISHNSSSVDNDKSNISSETVNGRMDRIKNLFGYIFNKQITTINKHLSYSEANFQYKKKIELERVRKGKEINERSISNEISNKIHLNSKNSKFYSNSNSSSFSADKINKLFLGEDSNKVKDIFPLSNSNNLVAKKLDFQNIQNTNGFIDNTLPSHFLNNNKADEKNNFFDINKLKVCAQDRISGIPVVSAESFYKNKFTMSISPVSFTDNKKINQINLSIISNSTTNNKNSLMEMSINGNAFNNNLSTPNESDLFQKNKSDEIFFPANTCNVSNGKANRRYDDEIIHHSRDKLIIEHVANVGITNPIYEKNQINKEKNKKILLDITIPLININDTIDIDFNEEISNIENISKNDKYSIPHNECNFNGINAIVESSDLIESDKTQIINLQNSLVIVPQDININLSCSTPIKNFNSNGLSINENFILNKDLIYVKRVMEKNSNLNRRHNKDSSGIKKKTNNYNNIENHDLTHETMFSKLSSVQKDELMSTLSQENNMIVNNTDLNTPKHVKFELKENDTVDRYDVNKLSDFVYNTKINQLDINEKDIVEKNINEKIINEKNVNEKDQNEKLTYNLDETENEKNIYEKDKNNKVNNEKDENEKYKYLKDNNEIQKKSNENNIPIKSTNSESDLYDSTENKHSLINSIKNLEENTTIIKTIDLKDNNFFKQLDQIGQNKLKEINVDLIDSKSYLNIVKKSNKEESSSLEVNKTFDLNLNEFYSKHLSKDSKEEPIKNETLKDTNAIVNNEKEPTKDEPLKETNIIVDSEKEKTKQEINMFKKSNNKPKSERENNFYKKANNSLLKNTTSNNTKDIVKNSLVSKIQENIEKTDKFIMNIFKSVTQTKENEDTNKKREYSDSDRRKIKNKEKNSSTISSKNFSENNFIRKRTLSLELKEMSKNGEKFSKEILNDTDGSTKFKLSIKNIQTINTNNSKPVSTPMPISSQEKKHSTMTNNQLQSISLSQEDENYKKLNDIKIKNNDKGSSLQSSVAVRSLNEFQVHERSLTQPSKNSANESYEQDETDEDIIYCYLENDDDLTEIIEVDELNESESTLRRQRNNKSDTKPIEKQIYTKSKNITSNDVNINTTSFDVESKLNLNKKKILSTIKNTPQIQNSINIGNIKSKSKKGIFNNVNQIKLHSETENKLDDQIVILEEKSRENTPNNTQVSFNQQSTLHTNNQNQAVKAENKIEEEDETQLTLNKNATTNENIDKTTGKCDFLIANFNTIRDKKSDFCDKLKIGTPEFSRESVYNKLLENRDEDNSSNKINLSAIESIDEQILINNNFMTIDDKEEIYEKYKKNVNMKNNKMENEYIKIVDCEKDLSENTKEKLDKSIEIAKIDSITVNNLHATSDIPEPGKSHTERKLHSNNSLKTLDMSTSSMKKFRSPFNLTSVIKSKEIKGKITLKNFTSPVKVKNMKEYMSPNKDKNSNTNNFKKSFIKSSSNLTQQNKIIDIKYQSIKSPTKVNLQNKSNIISENDSQLSTIKTTTDEKSICKSKTQKNFNSIIKKVKSDAKLIENSNNNINNPLNKLEAENELSNSNGRLTNINKNYTSFPNFLKCSLKKMKTSKNSAKNSMISKIPVYSNEPTLEDGIIYSNNYNTNVLPTEVSNKASEVFLSIKNCNKSKSKLSKIEISSELENKVKSGIKLSNSNKNLISISNKKNTIDKPFANQNSKTVNLENSNQSSHPNQILGYITKSINKTKNKSMPKMNTKKSNSSKDNKTNQKLIKKIKSGENIFKHSNNYNINYLKNLEVSTDNLTELFHNYLNCKNEKNKQSLAQVILSQLDELQQKNPNKIENSSSSDDDSSVFNEEGLPLFNYDPEAIRKYMYKHLENFKLKKVQEKLESQFKNIGNTANIFPDLKFCLAPIKFDVEDEINKDKPSEYEPIELLDMSHVTLSYSNKISKYNESSSPRKNRSPINSYEVADNIINTTIFNVDNDNQNDNYDQKNNKNYVYLNNNIKPV